MKKNDRLNIIEAIESASESELKELARINESLKQLAGRSEVGEKSAEVTHDNGAKRDPALVISRRLSSKNKDEASPSKNRTDAAKKSPYNEDYNAPSRSDNKVSESPVQANPKKEPNQRTKKATKGKSREHERTGVAGSTENTSEIISDEATGYKERLTRARGSKASQSPDGGRDRNPVPSKALNKFEGEQASGAKRDSKGRFVSREIAQASENTRQQKISLKEQEKLQIGFFGRLTKLFTSNEKGGTDLHAGGADIVGGAAVGGPIWTLGKGMFDIGKAVSDNALSLKDWVSNSDKEPTETKPAKTQPPVIVQPPAPPKIGEPKSATEFAGGIKDAAADATVEQTRIIDKNDGRIIDELDGIRRDLKKLGKDGAGLGGLQKLFSRRSPGRAARTSRNARNGKEGRRGRDARSANNEREGREKGKGSGRNNQREGAQSDKVRNKTRRGKTSASKLPGGKPSRSNLKAILSGKALKAVGGVTAGGALATAAATHLPEKATMAATEKVAAQALKTASPATKATEKAIVTAAKPAAEATAKTAAAVAGTGTAVAGTTAAAKAVSESGTKAADATATKAVKTAAAKTVENSVENTAAKTTTKTVEASASKTATEAGEAVAKKGALSAGTKIGAKTALKAIPLIGTAIGVGMDAYDGATDEEGQRETFNVDEGKQVSTQQKAAYTMANVVNMGGLVSGAAGLFASGARAVGMDKVADALTFDTGSIAKGLDNGMSTVRDAVTKLTDSNEGKSKDVTKVLTDQTLAINSGTDKTVGAINRLGTQLQGGEWGEDNVGAAGKSVADYDSVSVNDIAPDLNIGGKNAKVRSFRNNNFGNLNYVGQEGARLEDPNANGEARFAKFNTPEEGFRALANQLTAYSNGKSKATGGRKLNTVEDIIGVYAPKNENDTQQYVKSLSEKLGVRSDEQLDMTNPEVMTKMMRGIATIEGGNPQVTDQFIRDSIGRHENGKWVDGKFSDQSLKVVNEERAKKGLAPVAANSLFSSGAKAVTSTKEAEPIRPSVSETLPVVEAGRPVSMPAATPSANKPAATPQTKEVTQDEKKQTPSKPEVAPSLAASLSPISSVAAATLPVAVVAPAAELNKEKSEATASIPPLSAKQHASQTEKQEKASDSKADAGGDSFSSKFKSMMTKGLAAATGAPEQADAWVQEIMQEKGIEGMSRNRPDAGLTLPAGVKLPSALSGAAKLPTEIAKQNHAMSTRPAGVKQTAETGPGNNPLKGAENTKSSTPVKGKWPSILPGATATEGQEPSTFDKVLDGAMDGFKAVGASIMPAVSDTLNQTVSGFSGTQVVSDLMGQVGLSDPSVQRAIAPITDKAGNWLENGMTTVKDASSAMLNGSLPEAQQQPSLINQPSSLAIPATMQTVQDLARSGVRPSLSSDNTANYDVDMLKELKAMSGTLEQLLGVSKQKDDAPAKVVNTAQPAPRSAAALTIKDEALNELLRD
ncbi:hypothetical protein [Atlantibacter hermannii]|uniref:hypothetical protein n=1 Tax=Atlantibacter hermannii TaxID=565 RepID=UPI0028A26A49|nr:hypothetical protein [Atlantibacter hermannii]